jgi:hypothetical protein
MLCEYSIPYATGTANEYARRIKPTPITAQTSSGSNWLNI